MKPIPGLLLLIFPFILLHGQPPSYEQFMDHLNRLEKKGNFTGAQEYLFTQYQLWLPPGFNPDKTYPLFLIFHGENSNFRRVGKHWNEELLDNHFIKVYLQSYRHFDSESFTWRSGDKCSDRDIREIYKEIRHAYPVDTSRVLVSGMSAGATYAIGMALRGVIPVSGLLVFCPGWPAEIASQAEPDIYRSDIRAYLLGGENDYYRKHQERLCGMFDQIGLDFLYVIEDSMSHQYPENEGKYISEGIHFIMEQ